MALDGTDRKILAALMKDARLPLARLADRLGVATSTVHHRVRKLTDDGVIRGSHLELDWETVGLPVVGLVSLAIGNSTSKAEAAVVIEALEYVQTCYSTSGEFDLFVVIRASSSEHLEEVVDRLRSKVPVSAMRTVVVLSTHFEDRMPPMDR